MIQPLSHFITVTLQGPEAPSSIIVAPPSDNPMRWATIDAIGPLVTDLAVGQSVLISVHQGTTFGDSLLLPQSSVVLVGG
jgi:hypothetical protein